MKGIVSAVSRVIRRARARRSIGAGGDAGQISSDRTRQQRELTRYQGQAGADLTVQTTIDMARTQTWTGGG